MNMPRKKTGTRNNDFQVSNYIRKKCEERNGNNEESCRMSLRRRRSNAVANDCVENVPEDNHVPCSNEASASNEDPVHHFEESDEETIAEIYDKVH